MSYAFRFYLSVYTTEERESHYDFLVPVMHPHLDSVVALPLRSINEGLE